MVGWLPEMRNKSPKESGVAQSVSTIGHAQRSAVTLGSKGCSGQGRLGDAGQRTRAGADAGRDKAAGGWVAARAAVGAART